MIVLTSLEATFGYARNMNNSASLTCKQFIEKFCAMKQIRTIYAEHPGWYERHRSYGSSEKMSVNVVKGSLEIKNVDLTSCFEIGFQNFKSAIEHNIV